jgi:hypothetical protein
MSTTPVPTPEATATATPAATPAPTISANDPLIASIVSTVKTEVLAQVQASLPTSTTGTAVTGSVVPASDAERKANNLAWQIATGRAKGPVTSETRTIGTVRR